MGIDRFFVPLKLVKKLKKLGFNEPTFAYYTCEGLEFKIRNYNGHMVLDVDTDGYKYNAPLFGDVFQWFNERGLSNDIKSVNGEMKQWTFTIKYNDTEFESEPYDSRTCVRVHCVKELLRIVKMLKKD
jgi:hypothetical protein